MYLLYKLSNLAHGMSVVHVSNKFGSVVTWPSTGGDTLSMLFENPGATLPLCRYSVISTFL